VGKGDLQRQGRSLYPAIIAPIIGARNLEQLEDSLPAIDVDMTPEWRYQISSLSITTQPATIAEKHCYRTGRNF
jgi:hypothetical protein